MPITEFDSFMVLHKLKRFVHVNRRECYINLGNLNQPYQAETYYFLKKEYSEAVMAKLEIKCFSERSDHMLDQLT